MAAASRRACCSAAVPPGCAWSSCRIAASEPRPEKAASAACRAASSSERSTVSPGRSSRPQYPARTVAEAGGSVTESWKVFSRKR